MYKKAGSFNLDPAGGGVARIAPGSNVTVDSTDPTTPKVSAEAGGGGVPLPLATYLEWLNNAAQYGVIQTGSFIGFILVGDTEAVQQVVFGDGSNTAIFITPGIPGRSDDGVRIQGSNPLLLPANSDVETNLDPNEGRMVWDYATHSLRLGDGSAWLTVSTS